jgi:hypothetical protein
MAATLGRLAAVPMLPRILLRTMVPALPARGAPGILPQGRKVCIRQLESAFAGFFGKFRPRFFEGIAEFRRVGPNGGMDLTRAEFDADPDRFVILERHIEVHAAPVGGGEAFRRLPNFLNKGSEVAASWGWGFRAPGGGASEGGSRRDGADRGSFGTPLRSLTSLERVVGSALLFAAAG